MKIFQKHLLVCALITLLSGNAAEKFPSDEDVLTQDANFSQDVDYRLPKSIKPISYEIMLMPKLKDDFSFDGTIKITAVVEEATNEIVLHVGNIVIVTNNILINTTKLDFKSKYDNITEKYTFTTSETLKKATEILITFEYQGILSDNMIGFYRSSYFDKDGQLKWLAATQFQATHARHAFPCFDEPSFKARFKIRILREKKHNCLSNMPLNQTEILEGDKIWDNFEESVPMSTYLVAFVISEFRSAGQDKFKVWARPSVINQTEYALNIGTQALKLLSDAFQQEYQLPKMDMVAIPDFAAGAMENWGLVTYRETRMLHDEEESSASAQQRVASVIVHELTHMWFGNLVTPEWWSYLWLSEAFARYFQYFGTAEIEKSWNMKEQFLVEQHQSALITDGLESSQPMTRNVFSQSQIGGMGDTITYAKGASIVRMMSLQFGTDVFKLALRDYLQNNKDKGLGHPDALWEAIQNQVNNTYPVWIPVKVMMDTWTTQAGYPVISVTVNKKDEVNIVQERFLLRNLDKTSTNVKWWLPLTWTTQKESNFNDTIPKKRISVGKVTLRFPLDLEEWVIFNIQSSGFYRVNYDSEGWQRIFNVLNSDKFNEIHVLNRAGIVDDLLNLGRAGYQKYDTVLNGITYLQRETNYLPFKAAFNGLDYLNKRFTGYMEHSLFKKYVLYLINGRRETLGYDDRKDDDRLMVLLRQEMNNWACNFDDYKCVKVYLDKFKQWRNASIPIKSNERTIAYCIGVKYGTFEDWEFLWKQYFDSNYPTDQMVIINALGCSSNTTILEKYLKYAISNYEINRIRKQDSASVFAAVYNSGLIGAEYILDFVEKYHKEMETYYGGQSTIATILNGASQYFSTAKLVVKFESLIEGHKTEFAPILESLRTSLKIAKYELEWYKSTSASIIQWLQTYIDAREGDTLKYRLPTNIIPKKYDISVMPSLEVGNIAVDGKVKIEADIKQKTKQIVLHSAEMDIEHDKVIVMANEKKVDKIVTRKDRKYDFYIIDLDDELTVGTKLTIEIKYTSYLNASELRGFYKSSYVDKNGETRWLAATHLEPVGARKMFPCFDEPAMKAQFTIHVNVPLDYDVVSNMEWKSIDKTGDRQWYTFFESVPMSTYLVAVIISDFEFMKMDKTKFAVLARPNAINQTEFALSVIPPFVEFFENTFKQSYRISKLFMVALPDFPSGAGENWGLLTYRESNLLYDENHSSIINKQAIRNVIAHEISHQWFGNLVSPKWWKYLWLNEGFARYFEYHVPARVFNDATLELQFIVDQVHSAFSADSSESAHSLNHDVYSPREIRSIFDTITYAKGASILRMVEKLYGTELFYTALSNYLMKRANKTATPEDLYEALQAQIKKKGLKDDIETILETWISQPGYPVVHVSFEEGVMSLKQERFFFKKQENDSIWHIPITWALVDNDFNYPDTTPNLWLTIKEMKAWSPINSLFIFNVQQSGYYRVNYDEEHWWKLIDYLTNETDITTIHEINRAALIDDLMNLARADYVDYKLVISAGKYLRRETNYLPWRAFYNNLPYLNNRFRGRAIEGLYKKYLTDLIKPLYKQLGFIERKDDDHLTKILRIHTRKWACELSIEDCEFYAKKYFRMKQNLGTIPPNYRDVVYCTAMKMDNTKNTYKYLWKEYLNSNVAAHKLVILSSLACSQNRDVLETLLRDAITEDSGIRYQDSARVFSDVYSASLIGVEVVMNVIEQYYDEILHLHFDDYTKIGSILSSLASRLSTHDLYKQFLNLLDSLIRKESKFKESVDSYLSTAKYEFDWYERETPGIFEELNKMFLSNNEYRLPKTFYPELYNVQLTPHMKEGTFEGKMEIRMKAIEEALSIVLNSHNLEIVNVTVFRNYIADNRDDDDKPIKVLNYTYNDPQQLRIYLAETVSVDEKITTKIHFNGILNDNMNGFYRSSYLDSDGTQHWLATTQFEPTYAREAFPCFDEPAFKSNFTINIQRPKHYNALSNMPRKYTLSNDDYELDEFETSAINMPTYLIAFVVSEFKPVDNSKNMSINVWGRPEVANYGRYARDIAESILEKLQNFTDIEYPLPKLDLVGIPDFSMGAMENWGLATFREYGLFYDENEITATYEKYIITVIAHELAHMWFGNLVTCEWWDYIWLNEGFAQYFEWFIADQILPKYKFMDQFVVYELQSALLKDASYSAHPMTNSVKTPGEISGIFDYVTYGKSASVLRMIFNAIENDYNDKEIYKLAIRNYLNKQAVSGTARPTDLWQSFEQFVSIAIDKKTNVSVEEVMNTWTNQPGYPVVNAILNGSTLTLSQERFVMDRKAKSKNEFYWIPIHVFTPLSVFSTPITIQSKLWLGPKHQPMYINPLNEWFIVNYKQTGFYRVNYDTSSWERLIAELNSDRFESIPVLNRAQIIDDLFNLARTNYVHYELLLTASKYLNRETNHLPWKAFFNGLSYVYERFEGQNHQNNVKTYILNITSTIYDKLGFDDLEKDEHLDELNREMILQWACKLDKTECTDKSKKLFVAWRKDTLERIPRNARPAVYCTALKKGDADDWEFLWNQYLETNFASEQKIIINALGCSRNETVLQKYLEEAIKNNDPVKATIRRQDVSAVFASVYSTGQLGVNVSLNFLITHASKVHAYFNNWNDVANLIHDAASHISNKDQYNKLAEFVQSFVNITNIEVREKFTSALNIAENNLAWYETYGPLIGQWTYEQTAQKEKENDSTRIESLNIVFMTLIALISYFLSCH